MTPRPSQKAYKSKYRNQPVRTEEGYFASGKEHKRWLELKLLERQGLIRNLKRQVPFQLNAYDKSICIYKADATYDERQPVRRNGEVKWLFVVEDAKGLRLPEFVIKAKLFEAQFGFAIKEV